MQGPVVMIDKAGRRRGEVAPKFPPNLDTEMIREDAVAHRVFASF
jgi:hypothetical protein